MLYRLFKPPGICLSCELPGQGKRDLCHYCAEILPWNRCPCPHCAHPLPQSRSLCSCATAAWPFTQVLAPFVFAPPISHWIHRLKFHQSLVAGRLLGELLAAHLVEQRQDQVGHWTAPDLLLPIPLHWRRLLQRGLNQSRVVAAVVSRELRIPMAPNILKRTRHLASQHTLGREARAHNLNGAFVCRDLTGRSIALVDDVLTTGATVRAAAAACRVAGASSIQVWCIARTPRPVTLRA